MSGKLIIATVFCLYFMSLVSGASIQGKDELSAANNSSIAKSARGLGTIEKFNLALKFLPKLLLRKWLLKSST